ncbi:hypothetical protein JCM10207_009234 [Rhodosporidiobolus poonsookiae]
MSVLPPLAKDDSVSQDSIAAERPSLDAAKAESADSASSLKKETSVSGRLEWLRVDDSTLAGNLTYNQLSLEEKKHVLINREMDLMNETSFWRLGRYQLCGFGYFLDLAWAMIFGLVAGQIKQELGIANNRIGEISTSFSAGMTAGAFFWGILVDIIGRRWAFNLSCLFASVFGLLFAAPSNFGALCFLAAMTGIGVGGNIPIDATICLEFLPTKRRFLLCALSTFQPLGVVAAALISWGTVPRWACDTALPSCGTGQTPCCRKQDNMGWRYAMIIIGLLTLTIFFLRYLVFTFYESPKFLLTRGKDAEALEVLYKVAKFNKAPVPNLTIEDFQLMDAHYAEEESRASDEPINAAPQVLGKKALAKRRMQQVGNQLKNLTALFSSPRAIWLTATLWVAYMSLFFAFSISGTYLPLILRQKGIDTSRTLNETYLSYVIIKLPGITATILGCLLMELPLLGRRGAMVLSAGLMGASLFLFSTVDSMAAFTGMNLFEYWCQSLYAALLYASTPEYFPAKIRGSGSGTASALGRVASTVAPIAAGTIFNPRSNGVLYLAGGAALVSAVAVGLIPYEIKGKHTF